MLKLVGMLPSPFVRKACVVLAEKGISFDMVVDGPSQPGNDIIGFSPLGKIPIMVLEDDSRLFDSRVIVEHVDGLAPSPVLLPPPGPERIAVKRWEALADGICDAAVSIVAENRRPPSERSPAWIEKQREKVRRGIGTLAEELGESAWFHRDRMTLADLAVGVALAYASFRLSDIKWRATYPNLDSFEARLAQRASFQATANLEGRIAPAFFPNARTDHGS